MGENQFAHTRMDYMVAVWAETSSPTRRSWQQRDAGRVGKLSNAHTPAPSYVAHQIHLFMSRFVQKTVNGDPNVWASWVTPTCVGVLQLAHTSRWSLIVFCTNLDTKRWI